MDTESDDGSRDSHCSHKGELAQNGRGGIITERSLDHWLDTRDQVLVMLGAEELSAESDAAILMMGVESSQANSRLVAVPSLMLQILLADFHMSVALAAVTSELHAPGAEVLAASLAANCKAAVEVKHSQVAFWA